MHMPLHMAFVNFLKLPSAELENTRNNKARRNYLNKHTFYGRVSLKHNLQPLPDFNLLNKIQSFCQIKSVKVQICYVSSKDVCVS